MKIIQSPVWESKTRPSCLQYRAVIRYNIVAKKRKPLKSFVLTKTQKRNKYNRLLQSMGIEPTIIACLIHCHTVLGYSCKFLLAVKKILNKKIQYYFCFYILYVPQWITLARDKYFVKIVRDPVFNGVLYSTERFFLLFLVIF